MSTKEAATKQLRRDTYVRTFVGKSWIRAVPSMQRGWEPTFSAISSRVSNFTTVRYSKGVRFYTTRLIKRIK